MDISQRNIPLFLAFRVLFNARFYYPVLGILFIDFGLSLEQYAILNVAWAASIVIFEVPSGAMADQWGRKRMVVLAAVLMVLEMGVLAFAPAGDPNLLFALFLVNRILSGAAEASASGADEALAYDSLVEDGKTGDWPDVLKRLMRWQSGAFFVVMMVGAAVYDRDLIRKFFDHLGWTSLPVPVDLAHRLPALLTFGTALLTLAVTLALREPAVHQSSEGLPGKTTPWKRVLEAGRWILGTPAALALILCGLCFDSVIRLFLTFESNYLRLIGLPVVSFGFIGSCIGLIGFVASPMAFRLVKTCSPRSNFTLTALLILAGLAGAAWAWRLYGVWVILPLCLAMSFLQFFLSHYLNQVVDSGHRATVLSFRGLAMNLAYGGVGLLFAGLTRHLREGGGLPALAEDRVFAAALRWLPWYFTATVLILGIGVSRLPWKKKL